MNTIDLAAIAEKLRADALAGRCDMRICLMANCQHADWKTCPARAGKPTTAPEITTKKKARWDDARRRD